MSMKNAAIVKRATIATCRAFRPLAQAGQDVPAVGIAEAIAAEGGMYLDPRLWRPGTPPVVVLDAVRSALRAGHDSNRAATHFLADKKGSRYLREDAEMTDPERRSTDEQVADFMQGQINRANGLAHMLGAESARGVVGFRYVLSPRHLRPDICCLFASQNLHGLGPGGYPSPELVPWPAYETDLSFVVAIFAEQVGATDRAGRETVLQALRRLPPEQRESILGQTKAKYLTAGLLRPWMVRAPLSAVQRRLVRRGLLDPNKLETDPPEWDNDDE